MHGLISSATNPLVRRMRLLAERRGRRREGAFVVEGIQPVWRAVEAGWEVEALVACPELLADSPAAAMVEEQEARGVRVARLSRDLFLRVSERDGPAGLAAVVRTRSMLPEDLTVRPDSVFAALHNVANPGNLGTIIRTVDAVGGAGVLLVGETTDPFAPAAVRASMGSLFAVDVARVGGADEFFAWAVEHGVSVAATSGHADRTHWATRYPAPLAVLFGSEGDGLSIDLLERADVRVAIPMRGTAESLNLAVAAALVLYEVRRPL